MKMIWAFRFRVQAMFAAFVILGVLASVVAIPQQASSAQSVDAQDAMDTAYFLSYLESIGDFNTEYDFIHPDARAIIPRAAVVGWFTDNYTPRNPQPAQITGVQFVSWTWEVTGVTYPYTAQVSFRQAFNDGVRDDVVRLVQDRNGVWRWFFGRTGAFVNEVIAQYAPIVPDDTFSGNDLIDGSVNDIDTYWAEFFKVEPARYSSPEVFIFDQAILTACGTADTLTNGPFYCPLDETIYLNVVFLANIETAFHPITVSLVIAHEWGHHVQNELNLLSGDILEDELQADCLAGSWARDFSTRYGVSESEIGQMMDLMVAIGGDLDHGPGSQRTKEFLVGFYDGTQACF